MVTFFMVSNVFTGWLSAPTTDFRVAEEQAAALSKATLAGVRDGVRIIDDEGRSWRIADGRAVACGLL